MVVDNRTRWNSTYVILEHVLKLQVWIDSFIQEYSDVREYSLSATNILSKED